MHIVRTSTGLGKAMLYRDLQQQLTSLFHTERSGIANAANLAALLYRGLPDLNWVGFYFLCQGELVLGPFQGKVACVRIAVGQGVCGAAAERRETILVPDVHAFPGHIACDADSRSEIVMPLLREQRLLGVLDLDSPDTDRFDDDDRVGLKAIVTEFLQCSDLSRLSDHG